MSFPTISSKLENREGVIRTGVLASLGALTAYLSYSGLDLLRWNQSRYLHNWQNLNQLRKGTRSVERCIPTNDGHLVHVTGEVAPNDSVNDDMFECEMPRYSSKPTLKDIILHKAKRETHGEKTIASEPMESSSKLRKLREKIRTTIGLKEGEQMRKRQLLDEKTRDTSVIYLMREVEMLQWDERLVSTTAKKIAVKSDSKNIDADRTDYTYTKVWSSKVIDWRNFQGERQESERFGGGEKAPIQPTAARLGAVTQLAKAHISSADKSKSEKLSSSVQRDKCKHPLHGSLTTPLCGDGTAKLKPTVPSIADLCQNPLEMPRSRVFHTCDFCVSDFRFDLRLTRGGVGNTGIGVAQSSAVAVSNLAPNFATATQRVSSTQSLSLESDMSQTPPLSSPEFNSSAWVGQRSASPLPAMHFEDEKDRINVRQGFNPLFCSDWDYRTSIHDKMRRQKRQRAKMDIVFDNPTEAELMADVPKPRRLRRKKKKAAALKKGDGNLVSSGLLRTDVTDFAAAVLHTSDEELSSVMAVDKSEEWIDSLTRPDVDLKMLLSHCAAIYTPENGGVKWTSRNGLKGVQLEDGWYYFGQNGELGSERLTERMFEIGDIRVRFWIVTRPFKMTVIGEQRGDTVDRYTFTEHRVSQKEASSFMLSATASLPTEMKPTKKIISLKLRLPGKVSPLDAYRRVYKPHFRTATLGFSLALFYAASVCAVYMKKIYSGLFDMKYKSERFSFTIQSQVIRGLLQSSILCSGVSLPLYSAAYSVPYAKIYYERFPLLSNALILATSMSIGYFSLKW